LPNSVIFKIILSLYSNLKRSWQWNSSHTSCSNTHHSHVNNSTVTSVSSQQSNSIQHHQYRQNLPLDYCH